MYTSFLICTYFSSTAPDKPAAPTDIKTVAVTKDNAQTTWDSVSGEVSD